MIVRKSAQENNNIMTRNGRRQTKNKKKKKKTKKYHNNNNGEKGLKTRVTGRFDCFRDAFSRDIHRIKYDRLPRTIIMHARATKALNNNIYYCFVDIASAKE
jgi:hypothetical protein